MNPKLCECGCGQSVRKGRRFLPGHNSRVAHPMRGHKHTEEAKRKMSKIKRARVKENQESQANGPPCACGCGGRAKSGNQYIYTHNRKGTPLSKAHKQAIGKGSKAAWQSSHTRLGSQEHREKLRKAMLGREIAWRDKIAKTLTGSQLSVETRKKQSVSHGGDGNLVYTKRSRPGWKRRRKEIRKRDNYTCQEPGCGKTQTSGERKHHVHHINYDLNDLRPENLITLCRSCHGKTGAANVRDACQKRYTAVLKARGIC